MKKLTTHGPLEDEWVGLKAVVYNIDNDTKSVSEMWIDTDPFDAAGKPKNGWKKVYTFVDDGTFGGRAVTWGGKYETWRIDAAAAIDFKLSACTKSSPPPRGPDGGGGGAVTTAITRDVSPDDARGA